MRREKRVILLPSSESVSGRNKDVLGESERICRVIKNAIKVCQKDDDGDENSLATCCGAKKEKSSMTKIASGRGNCPGSGSFLFYLLHS